MACSARTTLPPPRRNPNDIVAFNTKHVVMEVFGAPDTVAAIACLDVNAQPAAFAKVIGPLMLAKHFVPRIAFGGSMVLFSGVAAWKPASVAW